ncbi:PRC-barrel domain-containing protein [Tenggerimyces flavus]|uniref:PRC-barrel domain-containing protein n=1 Tax=Tenggerimyces flavus TaxID=1708749 RepID=A0ABV7YLC5_9ACTN|nr:PRC-barrel domain-containing protein [Tenggerimyces flavus]MBM7790297.1 hypothetical protein [Tenggerimyces flavus]
MTNSLFDPWSYRPESGYTEGADLVGYKIAATDGDIGKVDGATHDPGAAGLVVDTGPWIFGRKVLLPAGVIDRIDPDEQKVYVDRTKDQIKDSPPYDPDPERGVDDDYRTRLGDYYGTTYDTTYRGPGGPGGTM